MLKIEKTEVVGWEAAVRGMRNPMNSWDQSDSHYESEALECHDLSGDPTKVYLVDKYVLGSNDLDLVMKLRAAGIDHRKFMRMIEVYVDITAPLYWWKEFDTYKVGTVANSCSTMHKIAAKEFTLEDFSCEHLLDEESLPPYEERVDIDHCEPLAAIDVNGQWCYYTPKNFLNMTCHVLNHFRRLYLKTKDKKYWWQMIQLLPTSYNQKRTIMLSYEVLANIYKSRRNHKLDEWHTLCDWIEGLPYSEMITGGANCPNKKITVSEADAIAACMLSKLQNSEPTKDLTLTDEWNQCGHMDFIQSVKSNCDIVADTIGKFKKAVLSQEKGDTSDAKPE